MLELASNTLIQALTFGVAGIGAAIAFRVIRYPDLTADGSFMLGSAAFSSVLTATGQWVFAVLASIIAGAGAGLVTATLNSKLGVSRLLSGILTSMIAYSVSFRLMLGRPNAGLDTNMTMFAAPGGGANEEFTLAVAALFALVVILVVWRLLHSELGLLLRTTGANSGLVADLGRSPATYRAIGLAIGNGLIALSAALVSAQQGFADINLGVGVIVTLIAALVLGEQTLGRIPGVARAHLATRVAGPMFGATIYFFLYLLILKASVEGWIPIAVEPTDLKLLSAALVVLVLALRRDRWDREELLPL